VQTFPWLPIGCPAHAEINVQVTGLLSDRTGLLVALGAAVVWKEARGRLARLLLASTSGDGVSGTVIWLAAIMSLHACTYLLNAFSCHSLSLYSHSLLTQNLPPPSKLPIAFYLMPYPSLCLPALAPWSFSKMEASLQSQ
jgi:hypothetical protein